MIRFPVLILAACAVIGAQSPPRTAKPTPAAPAKEKPGPAVVAKVDPAAAAEKPAKSETLNFTVNWPSGLSLGEGQLSSTFEGGKWSFAFKAEAAVPGFAIVESADSTATAQYCSLELKKHSARGQRKTEEKTTFDASTAIAKRKTITNNGGESEIKIGSCPRDALTFLHFVRKELAAGRLPAAQPVFYGAGYQTRVQYAGTRPMRSGNSMVEADKLTAHIKGPATEITIDLYFARDTARTPLLVETPLAMGKFSVEFSH